MSSGLMVYSVDLDEVNGIVGSRDPRCVGEMSDDEAVATLVDGGPYDEGSGAAYGYAYKKLCDLCGTFLDNSEFYPVKFFWLEEVDGTLNGLGVTAVSVKEFLFDDLPVELPSFDGALSAGVWSKEEVQKAAGQAEAVTDEQLAAIDDRYMAEAVRAVLGWIRQAAGQGHGVAGFYH